MRTAVGEGWGGLAGVLRMRLKDQGAATQLGLLYTCGRRPVELKGLGCWLLQPLLLPPVALVALVRRFA